jgi:N-methylhydantoinase A
VFSALGLLVSAVEHQYVQTFWRELEGTDLSVLEGHFLRLETEGREALGSEGFAPTQMQVQRLVELRYRGQNSELSLEVPPGSVSRKVLASLIEAFHAEHEITYGYRSEEGEVVEIVNVRVRARGFSDDDFTPEALAKAATRATQAMGSAGTSRRAYFGQPHGWVKTPIITRADLNDTPRAGPLIVEEYDTTVVVPPNAAGFVDAWNNIRIDIDLTA